MNQLIKKTKIKVESNGENFVIERFKDQGFKYEIVYLEVGNWPISKLKQFGKHHSCDFIYHNQEEKKSYIKLSEKCMPLRVKEKNGNRSRL